MMDRSQSTQSHVKQMVIAGCHVELAFYFEEGSGWSVHGLVACGTESNRRARQFQTTCFDAKEAAEQEALRQAEHLLGHNEDLSTSRTKNWT
jgi:hypothetical protein